MLPSIEQVASGVSIAAKELSKVRFSNIFIEKRTSHF